MPRPPMVPDDDARVDAAALAARITWDGIDSRGGREPWRLKGWRHSVRAALWAADHAGGSDAGPA